VAFVLDPEEIKFKQHGSLHKQMGYDTKGRLVWPDRSIHDIKPDYVMLYALPCVEFDDAAKLTEVMLAHFNTPPENAWMPVIPSARPMIPSLNFSYAEAEHVVRNCVNPVQQFAGEKDE
jgi:hypothetical protein